MGACSSRSSPNTNRVASSDDVEQQPRPIDPSEHPAKVAEIIYNSMRQRPKPLDTGMSSPTNSQSPSGSAAGASLRVLVPPGTLSSRARTSSRGQNSKKPLNKRANMFDLSELTIPPPSIEAPGAASAGTSPETPTSNELGSRRLAFVQTAAERENSLQRENSLCAPQPFIRKTSGTVSRVNDSDDSDEETDGEPAELSHTVRMQKGRHRRNVSLSPSAGGGMIEAIMMDATSPPRPVRMVDTSSPRVHGSPLQLISPRMLGFPASNSPDSSRRKLMKEMPFAHQVMHRQFESEFIPAPYKSVNRDSPLLNSHRGITLDIPSLDDEGENNKGNEITASTTLQDSTSMRSPPTMSRQVSSTRTEKLWAHYAGKENKHMYKKGLRQLAEDVYDEFVQRYKVKLFEINQAAYEKKHEVYTDELAERDLAVDLPILLPVANKKATREDFVKFVYSFLFVEMNKPATGGSNLESSRSYGSSGGGQNSHSTSHGDPKLSKIQFVLGWNHAQEVLFQIIERIKPEEKNQSPCKLM